MSHELNLSPPPRTVTAFYVILWVAWLGLVFMPLSYVGTMGIIIAHRTDPPREIQAILSVVWGAWIVIGIGGATITRLIVLRWAQRKSPGNIAGTYLAATLIWWMLIEGATFFGLTICMIEGQLTWHVFVALGLVGLIAISFPKRRLASRAAPG